MEERNSYKKGGAVTERWGRNNSKRVEQDSGIEVEYIRQIDAFHVCMGARILVRKVEMFQTPFSSHCYLEQ